MTQSAIGKFFSIGNINSDSYRFFKVTENLYGFGLLFHITLIPVMYILGADPIAEYNVFSIIAAVTSLLLNRKGWHSSAFILFYVEVICHAFIATHYLGWETGFYYYILLLAPLTYFNSLWSFKIKAASSILLTVSFTALFAVYHERLYGPLLIQVEIGHYLQYTNTIVLVILYSAIGYYYSKAANASEDKLRIAQQEAEWIANTDPLTHIGNRRFITKEIEREISRATRQQKSFIVALCDIDNFKAINDRYGHDFGDRILVNVAEIITSNIRKHDQAARWGGEEFIVLLPDTKAEEALALIERLRHTIAASQHSYKGIDIHNITMTFGLCRYDNSTDINDCINKADQAMYKGKNQGKNCTVMSDDLDANIRDIESHVATS